MNGAAASIELKGTAPSSREPLPQLREDLQIVEAPRLADGSPAWTIIDPVRQNYYRIGWREFEILSRWSVKDPLEIVNLVCRQTTLDINLHHIQETANFLQRHHLLKNDQSKDIFQKFLAINEQNFAYKILRNYLFFKIPLWRPDHFLSATMPLFSIFFSPFFWSAFAILGMMASYLTFRQLDSFQQTFIYFFSFEGLFFYGAALTLTKIFHEFGHAYTAKRHGLCVPSMGLAFILLWPILYTDTTDAWRLPSKKQRLQICMAGMLTEICIAISATFLWNFLPEGPVRSAAFFLATTTWLVTLSVNLNPFMRFDGYYILSDLLEVPNLQEHAFELAKWRLRKIFFGFKSACPVNLPRAKKNILLLYAYSTWLYRIILFLGIALLVYNYTFKILGIFLMAFEITIFITMPIFRELKRCWDERSKAGFNWHLIMTFFLLCGLCFLTIYPWTTIIKIPATYSTAGYSIIYPPQNGQLVSLHAGHNDIKKKGDLLFKIYSPELEFKAAQAQTEVEMLKVKLNKVISSQTNEDLIEITKKRLTEKITALNGYQKQLKQLSVFAPANGRVINPQPIPVNSWINKSNPLMALVDEKKMKVEGFVHEKYFHHIKKGDSGLFYDETSEIKPFPVKVEYIDDLDTRFLPKPYLASEFGGEIPVELTKGGKLETHAGYYKITMSPGDHKKMHNHVIRGSVRFTGKALNFFERIWPQIASVLIRESSF